MHQHLNIVLKSCNINKTKTDSCTEINAAYLCFKITYHVALCMHEPVFVQFVNYSQDKRSVPPQFGGDALKWVIRMKRLFHFSAVHNHLYCCMELFVVFLW